MGTATGPANLEADWTANTINLEWYNEDTKLTVPTTSNTCTYDGGITLPSTNPTKTGYTFRGWQVRAAAAPVVSYTACSQITDETTCGQYADNGCEWGIWEDNKCGQHGCYDAPSESWCEQGCIWVPDCNSCSPSFNGIPEPCDPGPVLAIP